MRGDGGAGGAFVVVAGRYGALLGVGGGLSLGKAVIGT